MERRMIRVAICLLLVASAACNLIPGATAPDQENSEEPAEAAPMTSGPADPLRPPVNPIPTPGPFPEDADAPRLFFTDLVSGPNDGGEGDRGAFVTLFGEGFGAERGDSAVTVGGAEVARYIIWGEDNARARSLDMIVVQLGAAARDGDIVVNVGGRASNGLPFRVRPGRIVFVSQDGRDDADGSFTSPLATIPAAVRSLNPGDIAYVLDGVAQTVEDGYGAALVLETSGASDAPLALVAYPGADPAIGTTDLEFGIRVPNNPDTYAHDWVLAGFSLRGGVNAVEIGGSGSTDWRVINNDISCPIGDGQTGCFAAALVQGLRFLGNHAHDIGAQSPQQPSKQYHAVYFTTDTIHVEAGWNDIHDNRTCRAIQVHSSPLCTPECGTSDTTGFNQYDISIHDNWIEGDACDGIVLATVDPSRGPVRVYNNILVHVGAGPHPPDGEANYSCIYVAGGTNTGPDGRGVVEVSNNTCYDFASVDPTWADAGGFARGPGSPELIMVLRNNLVLALPGQPYFSASSLNSLAMVRGSNNLFYGNGPAPDFLEANVTLDPLIVDPSGGNFHLIPGSPAIDAGVDVELAYDFAGLFRPLGEGFDLGAYEFNADG